MVAAAIRQAFLQADAEADGRIFDQGSSRVVC
jgi:hypothetical protein